MQRRSTRSFAARPLSIAQVALMVWAAQGQTTGERRSCPSAHALYPLTLTVVAGNVDGLAAGAYRYDAERDVLTLIADGDHRDRVAGTTLADHAWLRQAAALLLLSGDLEAAAQHFADQPPVGRRGERYVWLEAGHAGQSIYSRPPRPAWELCSSPGSTTTGSSASPLRSSRPASTHWHCSASAIQPIGRAESPPRRTATPAPSSQGPSPAGGVRGAAHPTPLAPSADFCDLS
ncbi:nitroreductase family protein [Streptomyces sp. NBC_00963]|uniref:nitroreductase family protein n=1 Tax=Streptomyces sp. NBC_00963 TaxID=2903697 RepID=UPI0038654413|nr:nitroreductase family protein [Streptomyces sp. NBC_00963]